MLLQGWGWAGWEPEDPCLQCLLNPYSPEGSRYSGEKGSRSSWLLLKFMEKEGFERPARDQLSAFPVPLDVARTQSPRLLSRVACKAGGVGCPGCGQSGGKYIWVSGGALGTAS